MYINSSINEAELEKFSKIANQWWDIDGKFKILHQINPIRLSYITKKINEHYNIEEVTKSYPKLNILDVGCGGGLITLPLHKLGANITGIDTIQSNIDAAIKHANEQNLKINYIKSTVEEFLSSETQESYDVILCLEVIEHVNNPWHFIKNLGNLLKSDGMLIISTINRTIKSYLLAIIVAEYVVKFVPKKTHDYSKFLKPSEIYSMLNNQQMSIRELKGLIFNLCNQTWQLSDDIDVNYFAYIVK